MTDWRTHEPIPQDMGGGFIARGPFGCRHLVGPAWSWWQCSTCAAARQHVRDVANTAALMMRESA